MAATDLQTGCGEVALGFYQMLGSVIVGDVDLQSVNQLRLNLISATSSCDRLYDSVSCGIGHIEAERLLVDDVFAVDECSHAGLKLFVQDIAGTDYDNCGELPQSFMQMLARCIVGYKDTESITHFYINLFSHGAACTTAVPMINCATNSIEAERMVVTNLFATDACGRLGLKVFGNSQFDKTYNTACGVIPRTFIELLAESVVKYQGQYRLNFMTVSGQCDNFTSFWNCNNNHIEPERALVESVFGYDSCGHLGLRGIYNSGEYGDLQ